MTKPESDDTHKQPMTLVAAAIRKLLAEDPVWSRMDPRTEINNGNCEQFMLAVCALVPGAEERTTESDDPRPGHYWVFHEGLHYDAEASTGVLNEDKLPIFQNYRSMAGY